MCITGNHLSLCFKLSLLNKLICQVEIGLNEMDFLLIGSNGNNHCKGVSSYKKKYMIDNISFFRQFLIEFS